jgi:hypothetical protein
VVHEHSTNPTTFSSDYSHLANDQHNVQTQDFSQQLEHAVAMGDFKAAFSELARATTSSSLACKTGQEVQAPSKEDLDCNSTISTLATSSSSKCKACLDFNSDKSTKKTLQSEHSGSSEAT